MKKILFIDRKQFGLLTDSLKYCECLGATYQIEYLCFDNKAPKVRIPQIKVTYLPYIYPKALRGILFLLIAILKCLFFRGFIYIIFFPKCSIIKKALFWKTMHIDIRTLSINKDKRKREMVNSEICSAVNLFESASFITEGVKKKISIKSGVKTFVLPLGADIISHSAKDFNNLRLLYIGTFNNRNILQTIIGVELFIKRNSNLSITYDIIGDGDEYPVIHEYIEKNNLKNQIHLHGRLPYAELKPYLDYCNVGISYVPIIECYEHQPPTKTYEYILSGLYCIATNTHSNREIVNEQNGILIKDAPCELTEALSSVYEKRNILDSEVIRNTLLEYQWKNIINKHFRPIIEQ